MLAHELGGAGEIAAFGDNHPLDPKLNGCAGAEIARHQRRIEGAPTIAAQSTGVAEAISLGMRHGIVILNATIMTSANQFSIPDQARADGDSALFQSLKGFIDRDLHEWINGRHGGANVNHERLRSGRNKEFHIIPG
jgi:hypothetical protein